MSETVPRPVLIALSILAGMKVLASAAAFADLLGPAATGLTLAVLAAIDVGVGVFLQGHVVPLESTIAYHRRGRIRAGGAAAKPAGTVLNSELTLGRAAGETDAWIEETDDA